MAKHILDLADYALTEKMQAVLLTEPDVVQQQKAIELLIVSQCARMGDATMSVVVAEGIHKHVLQMLGQLMEAKA